MLPTSSGDVIPAEDEPMRKYACVQLWSRLALALILQASVTWSPMRGSVLSVAFTVPLCGNAVTCPALRVRAVSHGQALGCVRFLVSLARGGSRDHGLHADRDCRPRFVVSTSRPPLKPRGSRPASGRIPPLRC